MPPATRIPGSGLIGGSGLDGIMPGSAVLLLPGGAAGALADVAGLPPAGVLPPGACGLPLATSPFCPKDPEPINDRITGLLRTPDSWCISCCALAASSLSSAIARAG